MDSLLVARHSRSDAENIRFERRNHGLRHMLFGLLVTQITRTNWHNARCLFLWFAQRRRTQSRICVIGWGRVCLFCFFNRSHVRLSLIELRKIRKRADLNLGNQSVVGLNTISQESGRQPGQQQNNRDTHSYLIIALFARRCADNCARLIPEKPPNAIQVSRSTQVKAPGTSVNSQISRCPAP